VVVVVVLLVLAVRDCEFKVSVLYKPTERDCKVGIANLLLVGEG